jgi:hypothetical protein
MSSSRWQSSFVSLFSRSSSTSAPLGRSSTRRAIMTARTCGSSALSCQVRSCRPMLFYLVRLCEDLQGFKHRDAVTECACPPAACALCMRGGVAKQARWRLKAARCRHRDRGASERPRPRPPRLWLDAARHQHAHARLHRDRDDLGPQSAGVTLATDFQAHCDSGFGATARAQPFCSFCLLLGAVGARLLGRPHSQTRFRLSLSRCFCIRLRP